MRAADIIRLLDLKPHPEGGHYCQTFRDAAPSGSRPASTAIYFLLARGERSHWHRVDAVEVWHHYAGAPLKLSARRDGGRPGDAPASWFRSWIGRASAGRSADGHWQAAESLGDWTLVGCTVAPGFEFSGFELAPAGWAPAGA